jgi:prepilin-type N-terminal cleavage/methylation domain-containing protein/prepilin-type processing-associated H-X9-DG protein
MLRKTRRNAFTLIELLVVIAIIGILASILFPVFARAREASRATTCLSNLKQITTAANSYLQDYDTHLLPAWMAQSSDLTQANINWTWPMLAQTYIKSKAVFLCPDVVNTAATSTYATIQYGVSGSYGMNVDGLFAGVNGYPAQTFPNPLFQYPKLSAATNPSNTVQFMDAGEVTTAGNEGSLPQMQTAYLAYVANPDDMNGDGIVTYGSEIYFRIPPSIVCGGGEPVVPIPLHGGGVSNAAYLDGHAKALHLSQIWAKAGQDADLWFFNAYKNNQPFALAFPTYQAPCGPE